ncbi:MAG TPA: universal stress protein [Alloiococcus sp.]|nr:universal stress protein [Alloiococcus sp.]
MIQEYKNILVAIDGSESANLAFKKAIAIAKRNNAKLYIVHVVDTRAFQPYESFDKGVTDSVKDEATNILTKCEQSALQKGVANVETIIKYGSPKKAIGTEVPKEKNIDLIILGATGLNTIERFFIGSVSENVIRSAKCDVLIVRKE